MSSAMNVNPFAYNLYNLIQFSFMCFPLQNSSECSCLSHNVNYHQWKRPQSSSQGGTQSQCTHSLLETELACTWWQIIITVGYDYIAFPPNTISLGGTVKRLSWLSRERVYSLGILLTRQQIEIWIFSDRTSYYSCDINASNRSII